MNPTEFLGANPERTIRFGLKELSVWLGFGSTWCWRIGFGMMAFFNGDCNYVSRSGLGISKNRALGDAHKTYRSSSYGL